MLPRFLLSTFCAGLSIAAAAFGQESYQPKPLPASDAALTQRRVDADAVAFWRAALLDESKRRGSLPPEWRVDVELLLDRQARQMAWQEGNEVEAPVRAAADRLLALDCDDPVVQLVLARVCADGDRIEQAAGLMQAVDEEFTQRPPSLRVQFLHRALSRSLLLRQGKQAAAAPAGKRFEDAMVALARSAEFGPGQERIWLQLLEGERKGAWSEAYLKLLGRLETAAGKPNYALLVLRARHHVALAWDARGTRRAADVSERSFDVFREQLAKARECATTAYQLCPQHPEAPTIMLRVLGPTGGGVEGMRPWFDRAVAAQFDHEDAYLQYLHYLQPRWGGSARELLQFGLECAATQRFDTVVPAQYRLAIHYQALDVRDPKKHWARAPVQKQLEALDTAYAAAAKGEHEIWVAANHRTMALALGGRLAEAAAVREGMQYAPSDSVIELYNVDRPWLERTLRPHYKAYRPRVVTPTEALRGHQQVDYPGKERARPLTAHPDATTAAVTSERFLTFVGDAFVAAHERTGRHDAPWDAEARTLLREFGSVVGGVAPPTVAERAGRLLDAGCDDPLVLYVAARALQPSAPARALELATKALPGLERAHSPAFVWWARQFVEGARRQGRDAERSRNPVRAQASMVAAAADPLFAGAARRFFVRCLWDDAALLSEAQPRLDDEVVEQLDRQPGADPWLVHVVTGLHFAHKALLAARQDPQVEQWLRTASERLQKAHELCPEFPEAAAGMVLVSTLQRSADPGPRAWFDRALDAQVDCRPAFRSLLRFFHPRSGGSAAHMYHFAEECLATARFDTEVPMWFPWVLDVMGTLDDDPRRLWAAPAVADGMERWAKGYLATDGKVVPHEFVRIGRCLAAWAGGRYDDALAAFAACGQKIDPVWLTILHVDDPDLPEFDLHKLGAPRPK